MVISRFGPTIERRVGLETILGVRVLTSTTVNCVYFLPFGELKMSVGVIQKEAEEGRID